VGTADQVLVMLRLPADHLRPGASYGGDYGDAAGLAARRRAAADLAKRHGLTLLSEWPMPILGVDCYLMAAPGKTSPEAAAAELSRDPRVAWSEPMHVYRAQAGAPPNDPLFPAEPAAKVWRLADLHAVATGRNVKVAVVDSRVDAQHPDLAGQVQVARDFLPDHPGGPETHGTAVAGVIAALEGNHVGIAGVAPSARLMALRACWQDAAAAGTLCDTLSLARALSFAIENGAQVINLSLSGPNDTLLGRLLDVAIARGATVVGAADPALARGGFPASHAGVVAVASEGDPAAARGGFLLAPGRDVPTAEPGGRWTLVSGSSFAAAHVTGLAALIREREPRPVNPGKLFVTRGGGEIDACSTLQRVSGACGGCGCPRASAPAGGAR
jgi:subtilisin family serine protease